MIVTTRLDGAPIKKPFTWSYSRLKNFEICALRHLKTDIEKETKEEESEQLAWGNFIHNAAKVHFANDQPLPKEAEVLKPWSDKVKSTPGTILAERNYAFTEQFAPCGYFDKGVWFRCKIDLLKLQNRVALAIDWKTGKILEDSVQLALSAAAVFYHHPEIVAVRTEFIWLGHEASSSETFTRADLPALWQGLLPRVDRLKQAWESGLYPPTPNNYCARFCQVTSCQHHGKRY